MQNTNKKKKILVFVDWFYPGFKGGGPIRSCFNLVSMLQHDFDIKVITRDTDFGETVPYAGIKVDEWTATSFGIAVLYLSTKKLSYQTILRVLIEENADHVYLNSLYSRYFTIYPLLACTFNKLPAAVILAPRGMFYASAIGQKSYKKRPYLWLLKAMKLDGKIVFHATNARERDSILDYFPDAPVFIANNLPSQVQMPFKTVGKEENKLRCVFISRIDPIKNLLLLLEVLSGVNAAVHLDIIGPVENQVYWQQCMNRIQQLPENIEIEVQGAIKNEKLASYISAAHLFVLLSQGENFGHAIFEAFLTGRPALISNQTPWHDLEGKKIGWDVDISQKAVIKATIEEAAAWNQYQFDTWAQSAWLFASNYLENDTNNRKYYSMFA